MTKLLYIKANPKQEDDSNSLQVGRYLVNQVLNLQNQIQVEEIDVYREEIPLVDRHFLTAREKTAAGLSWTDLLPEEQQIVTQIHQFTDQFIAADVYVFAFPLWNFGLPPLLKAYIDTIKVARKTFRYTPDGPEGLLKNKIAIIIQSSGDIYSTGPLQDYEHGSRFLTSVLSFIGVKQIETIYLEGMDKEKKQALERRTRALEQAKDVAHNIQFLARC